MTVSGHVHNGVVILDEPTMLPEGAAVEVNLIEEGDTKAAVRPSRVGRVAVEVESDDEDDDGPTLLDSLRPFIGVITDMPPDMARNHDHYLYGTPKRP